MHVVDVGFIPTRETSVALHDGMIGNRILCGKNLSAMPLKLSTHQSNHLGVVTPTERRAVQRNKALALRNKIQQRLRLGVFDTINVGVQDESIEIRKRPVIQVAHPIGISQTDSPFFQSGFQFLKSARGLMVPIISHEEQREIAGQNIGPGRRKDDPDDA